MKKVVDLHMHTIYSDGERTPDDLIKLASDKNISVIAITDHDSVSGLKNITVDFDNIKIINGIELTATYNNQSIHILGYNIDCNNKLLNDKLDIIRTNKFYVIINCLLVLKQKYNVEFDSYDIANLFNNVGTIGRTDLANLCVKYNYVDTKKEAFDKYLANIYDYVDIVDVRLSCKEIIDLIHEAGGVAVLAHPKIYKINNIVDFIKELSYYGLDGIEVYHSLHNEDDVNIFLDIASKYNLKISGGSDYHGENVKEQIPITYVIDNDITLDKLSILENIIDN